MGALDDAPWKLDDDDLVPSAGSCVKCPKRSRANPTLFDELFEHLLPGLFEVRRIAGDVRREDDAGLEQMARAVRTEAQAHPFVHQVVDLVADLDVDFAEAALHFAKKRVGRRLAEDHQHRRQALEQLPQEIAAVMKAFPDDARLLGRRHWGHAWVIWILFRDPLGRRTGDHVAVRDVFSNTQRVTAPPHRLG